MYYYVLESPQSRATRQLHQRLRDLLTRLGIAGEMVTANPARTPAEQAYIGITKGYSTIVAVGSDAHINEVAMTVIGRAVLGIIPIDATEQVAEIIGTGNMGAAAESLKHRRIALQDTIVIEPDLPLFLDGCLQSDRLAKISMIVDNRVRVHAYFNELIVTRSLELKLRSTYTTQKKKVLGLFGGGGEQLESESVLHGKQARITTEPILTLTVAGQRIAKTPLQLRLLPESLKVITKRGNLGE